MLETDGYKWVVYRNRDGWCSMCTELGWKEYLAKSDRRKTHTHLIELCRVNDHKSAEQLCQLANAGYEEGI